MFDLVNDITAYPSRFSWCHSAQLFEHDEHRLMARLDVVVGAFRTWFITDNTLKRPSQIDMKLRDGPFKRLEGRWEVPDVGGGVLQGQFEAGVRASVSYVESGVDTWIQWLS